jgi:pyocin large subunit-like protein
MERDIHFRRHGHEFGVGTPDEYEQMADAFMFGPINADTHECIGPNGNRRKRMDYITVHFGAAVVRRNVLITFYIPTADTARRHGGAAQLFADYCAQPD